MRFHCDSSLLRRLVSVIAACEDHECCKSESSICFVFLLCGTNDKPPPVPDGVLSGSGLFHGKVSYEKFAMCFKRMMLCTPPLFAPVLCYHPLPVPPRSLHCIHCSHPPYPPYTPPSCPVPSSPYPLTVPLQRMPLRNICFQMF